MGVYTKQITADEYCRYVDDSACCEPKILYKYRDWNNHWHKEIILSNKIYFASPASFEDELDCNVPELFPNQEELPSFFWRISFRYIKEASYSERCDWVRKWCAESPLANQNRIKQICKELKEEHDAIFGVLSLTANPNNEQMWEKYGANNKGVCIGFDKEKLFAVAGGGGPVIYTETLPIIKPLDDDAMTQHIKRTYYKLHSKWAFEEEYRLQKTWLNNNLTNEDRNILMKEGTIVEIHLGSEMSTNDKEEVHSIAKEKHPAAKIIEH